MRDAEYSVFQRGLAGVNHKAFFLQSVMQSFIRDSFRQPERCQHMRAEFFLHEKTHSEPRKTFLKRVAFLGVGADPVCQALVFKLTKCFFERVEELDGGCERRVIRFLRRERCGQIQVYGVFPVCPQGFRILFRNKNKGEAWKAMQALAGGSRAEINPVFLKINFFGAERTHSIDKKSLAVFLSQAPDFS